MVGWNQVLKLPLHNIKMLSPEKPVWKARSLAIIWIVFITASNWGSFHGWAEIQTKACWVLAYQSIHYIALGILLRVVFNAVLEWDVQAKILTCAPSNKYATHVLTKCVPLVFCLCFKLLWYPFSHFIFYEVDTMDKKGLTQGHSVSIMPQRRFRDRFGWL